MRIIPCRLSFDLKYFVNFANVYDIHNKLNVFFIRILYYLQIRNLNTSLKIASSIGVWSFHMILALKVICHVQVCNCEVN